MWYVLIIVSQVFCYRVQVTAKNVPNTLIYVAVQTAAQLDQTVTRYGNIE